MPLQDLAFGNLPTSVNSEDLNGAGSIVLLKDKETGQYIALLRDRGFAWHAGTGGMIEKGNNPQITMAAEFNEETFAVFGDESKFTISAPKNQDGSMIAYHQQGDDFSYLTSVLVVEGSSADINNALAQMNMLSGKCFPFGGFFINDLKSTLEHTAENENDKSKSWRLGKIKSASDAEKKAQELLNLHEKNKQIHEFIPDQVIQFLERLVELAKSESDISKIKDTLAKEFDLEKGGREFKKFADDSGLSDSTETKQVATISLKELGTLAKKAVTAEGKDAEAQKAKAFSIGTTTYEYSSNEKVETSTGTVTAGSFWLNNVACDQLFPEIEQALQSNSAAATQPSGSTFFQPATSGGEGEAPVAAPSSLSP